ncbi:hypothetical protein Prudu_013571 [Prunus dulcis]|uniref:Uncharacterized protein n=1 Tax=Prunus dulcis TaxID=3755 RepID=A0A4Y1RFZ3_PRUDU|nr:hypothetical protein Prudu_013571 [Prunus dulcis]
MKNQSKLPTSPATFPTIASCAMAWNRRDSAKILVESLVFSKWARHRGDVGTKTGSALVSGESPGRVLSREVIMRRGRG